VGRNFPPGKTRNTEMLQKESLLVIPPMAPSLCALCLCVKMNYFLIEIFASRRLRVKPLRLSEPADRNMF
jgi:hypothetical protein